MKTQPAQVLIVLDDKGNQIGMIMGNYVYRLELPLQGEEIAEVMTNGGDALPIMPRIPSYKPSPAMSD